MVIIEGFFLAVYALRWRPWEYLKFRYANLNEMIKLYSHCKFPFGVTSLWRQKKKKALPEFVAKYKEYNYSTYKLYTCSTEYIR
jgi:hypothetical protein